MKKLVTLIVVISICFTFTACTNPFVDYLSDVLLGTNGGNGFVDDIYDDALDDDVPDNDIPNDYDSGSDDTGDSDTGYSDSPTPILYKVSDSDGSCVWLFGSVHIGTDEMYPLPDYVIDAYNQSQSLAVECNTLSTPETYSENSMAVYQLMYTDNTLISDHISPELYENAKEILIGNGNYSYMSDYFMPVYWSTAINQIIVANLGYDTQNGIDMNFLNMASGEGKDIVEIESLAFQYGMLASYSSELQELLLESAVENYYDESISEEYENLIEIWCNGDEEAFADYLYAESHNFESAEEEALYNEYYTAMRTERNINMADFAEDALMYDQQIFICVGAAHVVGEGAMADLLSQRGYTVELVR